MNILIVYSHPSKKSYTFQVLEQLKSAVVKQNWNLEVSDLYASDFQSDMSEEEYEREGFAKLSLPISKDVLAEQEKIAKADCIIFLYPVWWSDCPAKLKGWFDRVYSVGYAYGQTDDFPKMKAIPFGLVICTAGHPNAFLTEIGMAQSMETIMLEDRLGQRFKNKEMLILGGTLELENVMENHFLQINEAIAKIKNYLTKTQQ
ncbi:NAD(P)H-dependent oxidoreductase [Flavobacterium soyae]|uniref:NAD(P)H-dependent oxidoreductase n=1 Tax=Flavobacterium soyae TaxID=2903098 RepID=UPI001E611866|nr:NAD(P)H-dependent oxidoreductase [Flavobacterium soyae]MCD9574572.1 NAD(P)H-dependent oxidoreductase [Flavobacterium soyae]